MRGPVTSRPVLSLRAYLVGHVAVCVLPVAFAPAYGAAEGRRRTMHAGYDSHVAKPAEASVFAPFIASLLPRERRA